MHLTAVQSRETLDRQVAIHVQLTVHVEGVAVEDHVTEGRRAHRDRVLITLEAHCRVRGVQLTVRHHHVAAQLDRVLKRHRPRRLVHLQIVQLPRAAGGRDGLVPFTVQHHLPRASDGGVRRGHIPGNVHLAPVQSRETLDRQVAIHVQLAVHVEGVAVEDHVPEGPRTHRDRVLVPLEAHRGVRGVQLTVRHHHVAGEDDGSLQVNRSALLVNEEIVQMDTVEGDALVACTIQDQRARAGREGPTTHVQITADGG